MIRLNKLLFTFREDSIMRVAAICFLCDTTTLKVSLEESLSYITNDDGDMAQNEWGERCECKRDRELANR